MSAFVVERECTLCFCKSTFRPFVAVEWSLLPPMQTLEAFSEVEQVELAEVFCGWWMEKTGVSRLAGFQRQWQWLKCHDDDFASIGGCAKDGGFCNHSQFRSCARLFILCRFIPYTFDPGMHQAQMGARWRRLDIGCLNPTHSHMVCCSWTRVDELVSWAQHPAGCNFRNYLLRLKLLLLLSPYVYISYVAAGLHVFHHNALFARAQGRWITRDCVKIVCDAQMPPTSSKSTSLSVDWGLIQPNCLVRCECVLHAVCVLCKHPVPGPSHAE